MPKCTACGTVYDATRCPVCSSREDQKKRDDLMEGRLKSLGKEQNQVAERLADENRKLNEQIRDELSSMIEEDHLARNKMMDQLTQEREELAEENLHTVADSWKLQADSMVEKAKEMLTAGFYEEAIKLGTEAVKRDPSSLKAYLVIGLATSKNGAPNQGVPFLLKAIAFLRTSSHKDYPWSFQQTLDGLAIIERNEAVFLAYVQVLLECAHDWPWSKWKESEHVAVLKLCSSLEREGFIDPAETILQSLLGSIKELRADKCLDTALTFITLDHTEVFSLKYGNDRWPGKLQGLHDSILLKNGHRLLESALRRCLAETQQKKLSVYLPSAALLTEINLLFGIRDPSQLMMEMLDLIPCTERSTVLQSYAAARKNVTAAALPLIQRCFKAKFERWEPEIREELKRAYSVNPHHHLTTMQRLLIGFLSWLALGVVCLGFILLGRTWLGILLAIAAGYGTYYYLCDVFEKKIVGEQVDTAMRNGQLMTAVFES